MKLIVPCHNDYFTDRNYPTWRHAQHPPHEGDDCRAKENAKLKAAAKKKTVYYFKCPYCHRWFLSEPNANRHTYRRHMKKNSGKGKVSNANRKGHYIYECHPMSKISATPYGVATKKCCHPMFFDLAKALVSENIGNLKNFLFM